MLEFAWEAEQPFSADATGVEPAADILHRNPLPQVQRAAVRGLPCRRP